MARQLHLSEGYMQVVYKNTFGISCMDDCINARIRLAKDQLRYTGKQLRPSRNSAATTMLSISAASLSGLWEKARVRSGHPQKNAARTGFRKGKANLLFHHNLHGNLRQLRRQILFLRHFQDRIAVGTKMHTAQS